MSFIGGRRSGLGYIVSENGQKRLEYRTLPEWFSEQPHLRKAGAYCTLLSDHRQDIDDLKRSAAQLEINGQQADAIYAAEAADYMDGEVRLDVKKLMRQGVTKQEMGRIPVCVSRLRDRKWKARTNRVHEAFHAKIRNMPNLSCALVDVGLRWTTTTKGARWLIEASRAGWTPSGDDATAVEEVMARLEEVRQSCVVDRRKRGCDDVKGRVFSGIGAALKSEQKTESAIEAFNLLSEGVRASGPIDELKKASVACQLRSSKAGK